MKHLFLYAAHLMTIGIFIFSSALLRADETKQATVKAFSPIGTVRDVRQVRATFSQAMAPIGKPDAPPPFSIDCAEKGRGRWIDSENWIYDFDRDVPRNVSCTFKFKSASAASGESEFKFHTGQPVIVDIRPYEGAEISEDQAFIAIFDGNVTRKEVLNSLNLMTDGVQNRLPVDFLSSSDTRTLMKSRQFKFLAKDIDKTVFAVHSAQNFPPSGTVRLQWAGDARKFEFRVRAPLAAELSCERENANAPCLPISTMRLHFTSPIDVSYLKQISLKAKSGEVFHPLKVMEMKQGQSATSVEFPKPLAASAEYSVELPKDLKDISGRSLTNATRFPLTIKTGAYPPLIKFAANFGILEAKNPVLPVTVRAVEQKLHTGIFNVKSLRVASGDADFLSYVKKVLDNAGVASPDNKSVLAGQAQVQTSKLEKPSGGKEFEVMGIPLKDPGFYVVEVDSSLLGSSLIGANRPMFISTAVLVTDLAVHLKWARERSLVWVTELSTAKPVSGAKVAVYDCHGKELWNSQTDASGLAFADRLPQTIKECPSNYSLIATAQRDSDRSFVLDSWDQGLEPFRFNANVSYETAAGPNTVAHAILSRSLLRAGETLHIKHILRQEVGAGFQIPNAKISPGAIMIQHVGSDEKYLMPVKFDAAGVATSEWKIPKEAKLGTYQIAYLKNIKANPDWNAKIGATFRVEEFRVPVMKGLIQGPQSPLVAPSSIPVGLLVQYLSGGGAANEKVLLRYQFTKSPSIEFPDYDDYVFAQPKLFEKTQRSDEEDADSSEDSAPTPEHKEYVSLPLTLDKAGSQQASLKVPSSFDAPGQVSVEMEYHDPSGTVDTVSSTLPIWSSDRLVGIKSAAWGATKDDVKIQVIVLDLTGKPQSGVSVSIDQFAKDYNSYRKKLVGGFFAYESSSETKRVGEFCRGKTDSRGTLVCEKPVAKTGRLLFQAKVADTKGRLAYSNQEIYVYDKDQMWFDTSDNDRIDLLTDAKSFQPGETARIQVRSPFRDSSALVTIEREGILDAFVTNLSGEKPEVKVPIKDSYAPNVYVSVLTVRGRVDQPQPTALVDFGKPAFKMGLKNIKVGWSGHELKIKAETDKTIYQTRATARLKIQATLPSGVTLPKDTEVAVAVVDEALLELMPNSTWNLLKAMMQERFYGVRTSTAAMNVIGKRHFGKKALPAGGGGGRGTTRELFDTLVLWKARVHLDSNGAATLDVPLNDSISKFRVAVIGNGGAQFFGSGETTFTTTRDLQILPGLPQLIRENDQIEIHATVRNATDQAMSPKVSLEVSGLGQTLPPQSANLAAQSASDVHWTLHIPPGAHELGFKFSAVSGSTQDAAAMKIRVLPAVPVRTIQATLLQATPQLKMPIEKPTGALPGEGGVTVSLQARLGTSIDSVVDYMRDYPYSCLEQRTSKAIVAGDVKAWREISQALPSYMDEYGLLKYWPVSEHGSDVLSAYFLSISNEAGWSIPKDSLDKIRAGLQSFVEGKIPDYSRGVETSWLQNRKLAAIEALSRYDATQTALLSSLQITPQTWSTSQVLDWLGILKRWTEVPDRANRLSEATRVLRSRLDFRGTRLGFSTENTDFFTALMISPDLNAARLMLTVIDDPNWQGDLPRLVRGMMDRRKFGVWYNTTANAWNVLAMRKFSVNFEKEAVTGITNAFINSTSNLSANSSSDSQKKSFIWKPGLKGGDLVLNWPEKAATLNVSHEGTGQPWVTVIATAAIPLTAPTGNGFKISKEIIPVQRKNSNSWSRGDIVRVRLTFEAQSDNSWVVVQDPIPAGSIILGSGLGRDSAMTSSSDKSTGSWVTYQERAADSFRAYYQYAEKGTTSIDYTLRINQSGKFALPPTHVEAMYAPDVFADTPNATIEVKE